MTTTPTALLTAYAASLAAYKRAYKLLQNRTFAVADRTSYTEKYYSRRQDASWVLDKAIAAAEFASAKAKIEEHEHQNNLRKARLAR